MSHDALTIVFKNICLDTFLSLVPWPPSWRKLSYLLLGWWLITVLFLGLSAPLHHLLHVCQFKAKMMDEWLDR